jgi:NTP pyrophosphatase (non-canonical NTP hydrolase)
MPESYKDLVKELRDAAETGTDYERSMNLADRAATAITELLGSREVDLSRLMDTCRRSIVAWGSTAQLLMLFEEMGELMTAISQYQRGRVGVDKVIEEIADVAILLMTATLLIGATADQVRWVIGKKLERLSLRLEKVKK